MFAMLMIGFITGLLVGWWCLHSYKKCLVMTAKGTQSENILGEWYTIKPEEDSL